MRGSLECSLVSIAFQTRIGTLKHVCGRVGRFPPLFAKQAPASGTGRDETAPKKPEHWLRLIVSSRNLTTEKNLEAGVVLDTDDFSAVKNKVLESLLQTAFKNNADLADCELVKYILHADFSAWARAHNFDVIEFLTPQNGLAKTLDTMKNSADDFVAVSPFLHNPAYLEKHLPANKPWLLITTSEVLDTVYDATTKGGIRLGGSDELLHI